MAILKLDAGGHKVGLLRSKKEKMPKFDKAELELLEDDQLWKLFFDNGGGVQEPGGATREQIIDAMVRGRRFAGDPLPKDWRKSGIIT